MADGLGPLGARRSRCAAPASARPGRRRPRRTRTVKDPYFRGIDNLPDLPEGCWVEPAHSTVPDGPHIAYFDHGRGWLRYVFIRRTTDPQIIVEEVFWQ